MRKRIQLSIVAILPLRVFVPATTARLSATSTTDSPIQYVPSFNPIADIASVTKTKPTKTK